MATWALLEADFRNSLTWLGHSSFLLRLDGRNILLDPFLSDYATLVPPLGPKRYIPPGLPVEKLPGIDLRVISKNHYDHLDRAALELLPNKDHIPVIVPLKLTAFISDFSKFSWGRCQPEGSSKPFESIAEG